MEIQNSLPLRTKGSRWWLVLTIFYVVSSPLVFLFASAGFFSGIDRPSLYPHVPQLFGLAEMLYGVSLIVGVVAAFKMYRGNLNPRTKVAALSTILFILLIGGLFAYSVAIGA